MRSRWQLVTFLGLVLLLVGSIVGCSESYTQEDLDAAYETGHAEGYDDGSHAGYKVGYTEGYDRGYEAGYEACLGDAPITTSTPSPTSFDHYENTEYGYTFDYPASWTLEVSKPELVFTWTPHDAPSTAMVSVFVFDVPISIPLEACPTDFLRAHKYAEDLTVLSSHALENKWNWYLEYTVTNEKGDKTYFKTFFKRVGSLLYLIDLSSVSAGKPSELQNVVDSFKVAREPSSTIVEYVVYENPVYGYKIEYPQDWELIETSTERTILGMWWRSIFGVITINIIPSGLPINEEADIYATYLADITTDEWRDLEVTYSHSLSGKWDWVLGFTFTDITDIEGRGPVDGCGEAYITQTPEYTIIVQWDAEEGLTETCKKIVDSFSRN